MAKSQALAKQPTPGELQARAEIAKAISEMARPEQSAEEMALAIINATTIDAILGSTVLHLQDMIGESFTILAASLAPSDYYDPDKPDQGGLAAFAVIQAELGDGSPAVITTGSVNCVSQLVAMHRGNYFPQWVKTTEDTTRAGYTVYKFVKGDGERPTQAQLKSF